MQWPNVKQQQDKKSLKIPKGKSEVANRRSTDNTMDKIKRQKNK